VRRCRVSAPKIGGSFPKELEMTDATGASLPPRPSKGEEEEPKCGEEENPDYYCQLKKTC